MMNWASLARRMLLSALTCFAALGSASPSSAQSIRSVVPPVADAGDVITIRGTNLENVLAVTFNATVNGGLYGHWFMNAPPLAQSATEIVVRVPQVHVFAGPEGRFGPGQLVGTVVVGLGTHPSQFGHFGWLESTFGAVSTQGAGASEPSGFAPRIGFALFDGLPKAGNANFTARVDGLPPTSFTRLGIGVPARAPYLPLGGGALLLDLSQPLVLVAPTASAPSANGSAVAIVPIPASAAGVLVAMQWLGIDAASGQVAISDALVALL